MFPDAQLFATIFRAEAFDGILRRRVRTTFLQRVPGIFETYPYYLPIMPLAVKSHNLENFDVVLSSSHSMAKGVRLRPGQLHLCYCYTPPRYLWDMREEYLSSIPCGSLGRPLLAGLRVLDRMAAGRVDHFAAISEFTRGRIRRFYRRDAEVIYPPCEISRLSGSGVKGDYFVTVSRLVPYKRVDLLVRMFSRLGLPLVVVGDGPEYSSLRSMAGPSIRFTGWVPDQQLSRLVAAARAFVFAALEDFGIAPVEAQAQGTPVVGYGAGGLAETVMEGPDFERTTGILFPEQTEEGLEGAVRRFMAVETKFRPEVLRRNAERFSADAFRKRFGDYFKAKVSQWAG